jgi:hypothetical protein
VRAGRIEQQTELEYNGRFIEQKAAVQTEIGLRNPNSDFQPEAEPSVGELKTAAIRKE